MRTADGIEITDMQAKVWFIVTSPDMQPLGVQGCKVSALHDDQIATAYSTEVAAFAAARRLHGLYVDRVRLRHDMELDEIAKRTQWLVNPKPAALATES